MADAPASPFHLFGIRHHGPGCARSLVRALGALQPDCILIEGPPDGEEMLPLVAAPDMQPPVALLVYNPDDAGEAVFYPYAEFSPEWQTLKYAVTGKVPIFFMDLPITHQFALRAAEKVAAQNNPPPEAEAVMAAAGGVALADQDDYSHDPLDWLGRSAGYGDGESWWNHMVEERLDSLELFAAIREAMTTVRQEAPPRRSDAAEQRREDLREAHMRKCMRQAQKDGYQRIAVVCGAWHVPALEDMPAAKADNDLLKGLPKTKVAATWVPWSYHNLSYASGYGAGVRSPGWYEYLWRSGEGRQAGASRAIGWLARAARLLREADLDCSSAHVIEAVRLADSLAAMRERPQASLEELFEALRTVVCMGENGPMQLIERQLVVGDRLGSTAEAAPAVPLQRDIAQQQKSLRLKPEAAQKTLDLDLRQDNDLARSHLLHRLTLLKIEWGHLGQSGRSAKGTFHEIWTLQWDPALALSIIEASRWGNSVAEAATRRAIDIAHQAEDLPALSELLNQVLLADLQGAIGPATQALHDRAAIAADLTQLLAAIPALANIVRYGNVRQTDAGMVVHLLDSLVPRAAIGLAGACASLDDDAAEDMRKHIRAAHQAIRLLEREALLEEWRRALHQLAQLEGSHGVVRGLAARLLFDEQVETPEQTAQRMNLALSRGNDPGPAAAWLEGFLNQSGMVLLHDDQLWSMVDGWVSGLADEHFLRVLPLLRRAFAGFSAPERRQIGERARRPAGAVAAGDGGGAQEWDEARALQALPLLKLLLGMSA